MEAQPDTFVPVFLALCGLWLHSWWLSIKPYVPERLGFLKQQIFVLPTAEQGAIHQSGSGSSLMQSCLEGVHDLIDLVLESFSKIGYVANLVTDQAELFLLVGCGAGLWLVLQRRRRLRMNQQAQPQGQARTRTELPATTEQG